MKWISALSIAIAIAAGVFAFQRNQAADAAQAKVASLQAEAQKAQAEMKAAQSERDALRKEAADLKLEAQELRSAAEVAGKFLESEKAVSTRLREDLAMVNARLAAAGTRQQPQRAIDMLPPELLRPAITPRPMVIRAAPGSPTAVGNAAAAPAPAR